MARPQKKPLDAGDRFPEMEVSLLEGGTLSLPADLGGRWAVILAYRGHW